MRAPRKHLAMIRLRFARGLAGAAVLTLAAATAFAAPLRVVTTTEDLAAIAREVGGERVVVQALARGYQDPHFVDAKPSYMVALRKADLFVQIGRELEVGWAPGLLNGARNRKILPGAPGFVDASARVEILEIPASASRAQGDVHPFGNPHYWLDPANGGPIARAIRDGLVRVAPADRAAFDARLAGFERRVADETTRLKARARALGVPGMRVVTYHRSWSYWARAFGCEVVDFVEPRPGIPPSPGHVASLAARLKQGDVRLILMEDFFDPRLPRKISADTGVPLAILPTSVGDVPAIRTYFDLFDHQLAAVEQALRGAKR